MTLYLQLLFDGVINGCAIGLVSISFAYFYATTGIFHVAHAGIYTLGGYVALYLTGIGVPFVPALLLAMACCVLVGVLAQALLYQKLEAKKASTLVMMIASIGLLTLLQNIVAIVFTPNILQFDLPWRMVGDAEMAHLACCDELLEGLGDLLGLHQGIGAVQQQQIEIVGLERR